MTVIVVLAGNALAATPLPRSDPELVGMSRVALRELRTAADHERATTVLTAEHESPHLIYGPARDFDDAVVNGRLL